MSEEQIRNAWYDALAKLYEQKLNLKSKYLSGTKREKVENYLKVIEDARLEVMKTKSPKLEKVFKEFFYDLFVIKEEDIPYSVYENEVRIAREEGYGNIPITERYIKEKNKQIIEDQKNR